MGRAYIGASYSQINDGEGTLNVSSKAPSISKSFSLDQDHNIVWKNPRFSPSGQATFCNVNGTIKAVFRSGLKKDACTPLVVRRVPPEGIVLRIRGYCQS